MKECYIDCRSQMWHLLAAFPTHRASKLQFIETQPYASWPFEINQLAHLLCELHARSGKYAPANCKRSQKERGPSGQH